MAVINCPNCGAPVRHLTGGDICEYCGTSFPLYTPFYAPSTPAQINLYADGELVESRYVDPFKNAIGMMQAYDAYGRRR